VSLYRATVGAFKKTIGTGPAAGALALMVFFGLDFVGATLDFMGFSDEKATRLIVHRYGAQIVLDQLRILLTYLLVGAAFGTIGAFIGRLHDRVRSVVPSTRRRVVRGVTAAVVGHFYFFARSLVRTPQLYSEAFYERGGARKTLMAWLTDHLTPLKLDLLLFALLAFAIGRPLLSPAGRALANRFADRLAQVRRRRWATGGYLLLLALTMADARSQHPSRPRHAPNILLIAVDSLRQDRVFDDNARRRYPTLAALADKSVRFKQAHVTVPRTFPSFVTLLTGRFPHHHGIRHMFPSREERNAIGPALPSALSRAGYRTAVMSDYAGEIFSRTPLGFDEVDAPFFDMRTIVAQRGLQVHPNVLPYATSRFGRRFFPAVDALPEMSDPARLARRASAWLGETRQPFFLTVFFSAAHFPYAAPYPYYRRFSAPGYDGPFRYQKPPLSAPPSGETDRAQIRALYDGAVAAVDDALARILATLERDGLADDTIVVLTADHGENLYDLPERGMGHGDHLHGDAADHVPLLILDPRHRFRPHDVSGVTRDVDLAPTLAGLAGAKPPPNDGTDLLPLLAGERDTLSLSAFSETELWFISEGPGFGPEERLPYPNITGVTDLAPDDDVFMRPEWEDTVIVAKHRAVRDARWKLLYQPTREGVRWSLYDLKRDPDERDDVLDVHPDVAVALKRELVAWMLGDARMAFRGGFLVPR
jgi:arylsulfatase A-like enzyme